MESDSFKKDFLEDVKSTAVANGEGTCAAFVSAVAQLLIDSEVLSDFNPSFYTSRLGRNKYRIDGYVYDEFDNTMNLIIANFEGNDFGRRLTNTVAKRDFGELIIFLKAALKTDLHQTIEMSTPCADLVDLLRLNEKNIRKYRLLIFTDANMSASIKNIDIENYEDIPVEGQIWDIDRLYRVCCSEQGRPIIEINFKEYCDDGIPCIEASSATSSQYRSYLGVVPGKVLADIYDQYGGKLLEGNVRSFLSTKVAVNKKIRNTIVNTPEMFFAFNNGISTTAIDVKIETTDHGCFITYARDFQIVNGGQTTASISNARFKDNAKLDELYVQMKLTEIDETSQDESDELIRNISKSSNSQNKVSDADFFASHPFHRRMEQISRRLFAPATEGAQYETKWFYERARGQYLQEQMRLTTAKKKQFKLQHPQNQLIKKTDLAKVQNTWLGFPHIVSKGAQTNFMAFATYIEEQWNTNEQQFNERYFQTTAALLLIFKYLEQTITKQTWYEGGYRANIIYYTVAQFRRLIKKQFRGTDLDLMLIWNKQDIPQQIKEPLIKLAHKVLETITDPGRGVMNVTQWCKKETCWKEIQKINMWLPKEVESCLISTEEKRDAQRAAKKEQKVYNGIDAQTEVFNYPDEMWIRLEDFATKNNIRITQTDQTALGVASRIHSNSLIPNTFQCSRLLALLKKAKDEGFRVEE